MSGLLLLYPFDGGRLPLVVEHLLLRPIDPHGYVEGLNQVRCDRWCYFPHYRLVALSDVVISGTLCRDHASLAPHVA